MLQLANQTERLAQSFAAGATWQAGLLASAASSGLEPRRARSRRPPLRPQPRDVQSWLTWHADPNLVLSRLALVLELTHVGLCWFELATREGASTLDELASRKTLMLDVLTRCAFRPDPAELRGLVAALPRPAKLDERPIATLATEVERIGWLLQNPALNALRDGYAQLDCAVVDRFEGALRSLQSFVLRQQPDSSRFRVAGELYQAGRLTLAEAAGLLEMALEDAVVALDQLGYHRPRANRTLDEERKRAVFAHLAELRARDPQWASSEDLVRRDVIATQRIESIDARSHLG